MGYSISWQDRGVIIKMSGDISYSEVQEANSRLFGDSRFDEAIFQLWDFTEISSFDLENKPPLILSTLDKQAMQWNPKMKVAVVSTNEVIVSFSNEYGLQINETSWQYHHFFSLSEAWLWVGID